MNPLKFWHLSFVQTEVKPPEHQVGKLKLSEAIRYGISFVLECKSFDGCPLGCAYFALTRDTHPFRLQSWQSIANLGGWPHELCHEISNAHFRGQWSREECADYAESQGC